MSYEIGNRVRGDRIAATMPTISLRPDLRPPPVLSPITPRLVAAFAACSALAALALASSGMDLPLFQAINGFALRDLPPGMPSDLTIFGHGLVAMMVLAPFLASNPRVLAAGILAAPLAGVFSRVGKATFARPRPAAELGAGHIHIEGQILTGHNSFPSGHSITIFLVAAVLVLGWPPLRTRPAFAVAMLCVALATASSRVMVGAHWPSDVLGGAALGILAGCFGVWAAVRIPADSDRSRGVLGGLVLVCAVALAVTKTGYPLADPVRWIAVAGGGAMGVWAIGRSLGAGKRR